MLVPGAILYLHMPSIVPPATKFAVVGCLEPKPMLFLFNSNLTQFKQSNADLMAGQIEVYQDEHDCLYYNCWLDCAEPHGYDAEALRLAYAGDPSMLRGSVSYGLRNQIINVVANSRILERRRISWLLAALTPAM